MYIVNSQRNKENKRKYAKNHYATLKFFLSTQQQQPIISAVIIINRVIAGVNHIIKRLAALT
jgi:hypothetical protein